MVTSQRLAEIRDLAENFEPYTTGADAAETGGVMEVAVEFGRYAGWLLVSAAVMNYSDVRRIAIETKRHVTIVRPMLNKDLLTMAYIHPIANQAVRRLPPSAQQ